MKGSRKIQCTSPPIDLLYAVHSLNSSNQMTWNRVTMITYNINIRCGNRLRHQIVHEINHHRKTEKQDNTECKRTGHQNQIFLIRSSMVDTKHHFDFSPPNMCRIADCFFTSRISGYRRSRRHFGSSFRRGICGEQHRNHTHKDTADDTDNTDTK